MDECLDSIGYKSIFSRLDCNWSYWQLPLHPDDIYKTTFTSHYGTFRYARMPFWLKNAPATFQRSVDVAQSSVKWHFAQVYIEDIIIFSRPIDDHFRNLGPILTLMRDAGFSLKLKKCFFLWQELEYLNHVVRPHEPRVQPRKCDSAKTFNPPTSLTGPRYFIGLCNVSRRFVKNFAKIAAPL